MKPSAASTRAIGGSQRKSWIDDEELEETRCVVQNALDSMYGGTGLMNTRLSAQVR